jgi:hypothetical protein
MSAVLTHLGVILACSLPPPNPTLAPPQCRVGGLAPECAGLNAFIPPAAGPRALALALLTVVVLGLPAILVPHSEQDRAMRALMSFLLLALGLHLASYGARDEPTLQYVLGLHGAVYMLLTFPGGLLGGPLWWGLRYAVAALVCALAALFGPCVSVVQWQDGPRADNICAFQTHLYGFIVASLTGHAVGLLTGVAGAFAGEGA